MLSVEFIYRFREWEKKNNRKNAFKLNSAVVCVYICHLKIYELSLASITHTVEGYERILIGYLWRTGS